MKGARWLRLAAWLDEIVKRLCAAVDPDGADSLICGDSEDELDDTEERRVADARAYYDQCVERRADARRELLLLEHGGKPKDTPDAVEVARRTYVHRELLVKCAWAALVDADVSRAREARQ